MKQLAAFLVPDAFDIVNPLDWLVEHFAIKKQESRQGLILRRGSVVPVHGEVREEGPDFVGAECRWVGACRTRGCIL